MSFQKFRKLKVIYQIVLNHKCKPIMVISKSIDHFNVSNVLNNYLIHLKIEKNINYSIILKIYKLYTKMIRKKNATHL